ncbi:CAP domain-containing protein [Pseudonocardia sp. NPDC049154]|uniref:CAP domain-containing protein n=1 Tax=Pseudonocardia sp. NPDC049154 TaxID=3155501 RepID=UPI0033D33278
MITTVIQRSTRVLIGVLAAGTLVGLAAPAAAEVSVTPTAAATQLPADSHADRRKERLHNRLALKLVNEERAKAGCAPLQKVDKLQTAASRHSAEQANRDRMGHDGNNGSTIDDRLKGLGYSSWWENVAQAPDAQAVVNAWMNSPTHRSAILNCAYKETGLDSEKSDASGKWYWTETFGG